VIKAFAGNRVLAINRLSGDAEDGEDEADEELLFLVVVLAVIAAFGVPAWLRDLSNAEAGLLVLFLVLQDVKNEPRR
jgi:hypothetical protein